MVLRIHRLGNTIDFDDLRHAEERDVEEPVADVGLPEDRL
jgi:hypothetical protein